MTLPDWRVPRLRGVRVRRIRTGRRRASSMRCELVGVGQATARRRGSAARLRRRSARRYADCGDNRCRSSGSRSPPRPCGWRWSARRGAARRTGHSREPSCVGVIAVADEDDLAAHRRVRRRLQLGDAGESRSPPPSDRFAGVAPLLPSAVSTSGCGKGATISARLLAAHPDRHVEGLDPDVGEAERRQPAHRPVARPRLGLGAGQARADFGGQPFDDVPGERRP